MRNFNSIIPPVIKWSGSKRNVARTLSEYFPKMNRYLEPFVGGGALLPFRKNSNGIAGDIIPELINDFCNEVLDQQVRLDLEKRYGGLRDTIVKHAFLPFESLSKNHK